MVLPFNIYKTSLLNNELEYFNPRPVVLGGGGLIQTAARKKNETLRGGWTISGKYMAEIEGVDAKEHALVVDTSPNYPTVNLYQIQSISGFCYATWTPIMVVFEQLFADAEVDLQVDDTPTTAIADFKKKFRVGLDSRPKIRTFLYLNGGFESGGWNWGGNSRTTAALLREDAWNYFMQIIV